MIQGHAQHGTRNRRQRKTRNRSDGGAAWTPIETLEPRVLMSATGIAGDGVDQHDVVSYPAAVVVEQMPAATHALERNLIPGGPASGGEGVKIEIVCPDEIVAKTADVKAAKAGEMGVGRMIGNMIPGGPASGGEGVKIEIVCPDEIVAKTADS